MPIPAGSLGRINLTCVHRLNCYNFCMYFSYQDPPVLVFTCIAVCIYVCARLIKVMLFIVLGMSLVHATYLQLTIFFVRRTGFRFSKYVQYFWLCAHIQIHVLSYQYSLWLNVGCICYVNLRSCQSPTQTPSRYGHMAKVSRPLSMGTWQYAEGIKKKRKRPPGTRGTKWKPKKGIPGSNRRCSGRRA